MVMPSIDDMEARKKKFEMYSSCEELQRNILDCILLVNNCMAISSSAFVKAGHSRC